MKPKKFKPILRYYTVHEYGKTLTKEEWRDIRDTITRQWCDILSYFSVRPFIRKSMNLARQNFWLN